MARSSHRARTVMDATPLERLEALAGAIIARMLEAGYLLVNKLTSAKVLPPGRLPGDVITIGRQVLYCHAYASRDVRVTLSWPEPTCLGRGRVSVLSAIAAVLLGLSGGSWSSGCHPGLSVDRLTATMNCSCRTPGAPSLKVFFRLMEGNRRWLRLTMQDDTP